MFPLIEKFFQATRYELLYDLTITRIKIIARIK